MATAPATEPAPRPNPGAGSRRDLLVVSGVSKRFGITQALDTVSVTMHAGEVHALMGENGAGKSTLGKAIAGLHKPDTGSITVDGRSLALGSIKDATAAGIRIVHQELAQCPNLSVAENLCLHDIPTTSFGLVDRRRMNERAARLVHALEAGIDVTAPLGNLSPGRRQICQIAAALDMEGADHTKRSLRFTPTNANAEIILGKILKSVGKNAAARAYVGAQLQAMHQ
jgi:ABC-type sugar transport system ATPase subunit